MRFLSTHICHLDLFRRTGASVLHVYHSTAQADSHGRAIAVEAAVVGPTRHYVFHGVPRNRAWNKGPHQQASDGSVSIGKVKDVGLFLLFISQVHSLKAGVSYAAVVIAPDVAIKRRHRVDAHGKQIVGKTLKK